MGGNFHISYAVTEIPHRNSQGAIAAVGVFLAAVTIAWACLKLYDEPARRWLAGKLLSRRPS